MGDPGAPEPSSQEERFILEYLRNQPDQKADVLQFIMTQKNSAGKSASKNPIPCSSVPDLPTSDNSDFLKISAPTKPVNSTTITKTTTVTKMNTPVSNTSQGQKRRLSPDSPTHPTVPRTSQLSQVSNPSTDSAGSRRLTVILSSSLPVDVRKDRQSLLAAVKTAAPTGIVLGEIKLTRNNEILVSCSNEKDHNCCLRVDKWAQTPYTFVPRFNLAASNKDILYIKSVPTEIGLATFEDHLNDKQINFSNLERVKTGKDRQDSLTLRLLVHDLDQKEALVRNGLLIDHNKFRVEPHVKTALKQCYRCLGFGHLIADCEGSQCCTRCGGDHIHKDCLVDRDSPMCANCARDTNVPVDKQNHAASDRGCPTRIKLLRDARRQDLKTSNPLNLNPAGSRNPALLIRSRKEFPPLRTMDGFDFSAATSGAVRPQTPTTMNETAGQTKEASQGKFTFGGENSNHVLLAKNLTQEYYTSLISTVLVVVADALTEVLSAVPDVNHEKIGDAMIRSVSKIHDPNIDIATVARSLVTNSSNGPMLINAGTSNHQTSLFPAKDQSTDLITALSNQVITNTFKKPSLTPKRTEGKDSPSAPKTRRTYNRKQTPHPKQRKLSESSQTNGSMNSISSSTQPFPLNLQSTPTGQRLVASATGASPMLGAASAPLSPNSSLISNSSQRGSLYMSPVSSTECFDISQAEAAGGPLQSSLMSVMATNLLTQLQSSTARSAVPTPAVQATSAASALPTAAAGIQPLPLQTPEVTPGTEMEVTGLSSTVKKQPERASKKKKPGASIQDG